MTCVSVIIPTFNRAMKTARAISSVLYQAFTDYEIIVVDDGSCDNTRDLLQQFGRKIRYIAHPSNRGVSAARNRGIRESDAPWIAFLDSDDYWLPGKLNVQLAFFRTHPEAVICQTQEIWMRNGRYANPKKRHLKPSGDVFVPSLRLCLISPSAVMLRRSLLEEVGLFDEDLPVCEDYDLWLRISCRHPVHLIQDRLVVKVGGHSDQLSSRYRGMDRFRIRALVKLMEEGRLNRKQREAVMEELFLKCRIYGMGCMKRGKWDEGDAYLQLPKKMEGTGHEGRAHVSPIRYPP
ncbi:MAG: glycosyltransferase [Deltaproteobacteria bacterium]|nr:glycosyltransferase [Deltaproteobacteria bacterium]